MKSRSASFAIALLLALSAIPFVFSQAPDAKFDAIKAKHARGEQVTPEERAYAQSVMAQRNQQDAAKRNQDYAKQNPPRESTGLVPLADLGAGKYLGEQGGLYPEGRNTPPAAHAEAGLKLAQIGRAHV